MRNRMRFFKLPLLGSNQDSPDPESRTLLPIGGSVVPDHDRTAPESGRITHRFTHRFSFARVRSFFARTHRRECEQATPTRQVNGLELTVLRDALRAEGIAR